MAIIKPFCGLRYNTHQVSISKVIAPPYDVISKEDQENLYALDEHNVVRLILGKDHDRDHQTDNRYTRARDFLQSWVSEEVLIRDSKTSIYPYEQIFSNPVNGQKQSRKSLTAILKLESFSKGTVFPHEKTYSKPKADRLSLLNATHTNLSPVFGLYEDEQNSLKEILRPYFQKTPLFEATDHEEVRHRFWQIDDGETLKAVSAAFENKTIVLADGHHRYETALNHWEEKKQGDGIQSSSGMNNRYSPCEFVLISLVDVRDPGLIVLPTHRLIKKRKNFSAKDLIEKLSMHFNLTRVSREHIGPMLNQFAAGERGFGIYLGGGDAYLAKLKSLEAIRPLAPKSKSEEWSKLEVSILSYVVFENAMGLKEDQSEDFLSYTRSDAEAAVKVDRGEFAAAFLLRSIPVSEIQNVCRRKDLMPHKSTYFYPKLASGLVFYPHS